MSGAQPAHGNRSLPRNVIGQRISQKTERTHRNDIGVQEKISQKWLNRIERIRAAQIEQHNRELHARPLMRLTNRVTFSGGVSGRIPWPRLKMKALSRVAERISSTA